MGEGARASPLLEAHRELGAKLTDFAGWSMPLQYAGIVAEHRVVRDAVGVFDVSHLGKLRVRGADGGAALQEALTADALSLPVGRARYALVLTEEAGCVDDVFVYRLADEEWLVVPNAANVEAVAEAIASSGGEPVDEWDRWAILAVQGPRSMALVDEVLPGTGAADLRMHEWTGVDVLGEPGILARTGYTGERGVELYAPAGRARPVFDALLEKGGVPVGLGARDTLRLEMGYALYGHELARDINPLEAGLGWAIAWDTPFRGRAALERVRAEGPRRTLFGVRCQSRGVPRQGYRVTRAGEQVATLTSGNFSPTLETGIGLALGDARRVPAEGDRVEIDARGRSLEAICVRPPFLRR
ncbi:MAG TPA: glycine cleavage system aminomethyltransferase GcvT [Actinomycetota bacterium]|nr:glycine cleavage system aminomethyltransferase GcvT [Actinomycetota bacterium]